MSHDENPAPEHGIQDAAALPRQPDKHEHGIQDAAARHGILEQKAVHLSGHGSAGAAPLFPEEELRELHTQDVAAARAIVVLMMSIFVTGLVLYGIIAVVCA